MTPVFRREEGFVFKVYSNEEERKHIHVLKADCEAKYWLEPTIELDYSYGFNSKELKKIKQIIEDNASDFKYKFAIHVGKRSDDK